MPRTVDMELGVSQSSELELSISPIPFFKISLFIIGEKDDFVKMFLWIHILTRERPCAKVNFYLLCLLSK